jgi:hypothetical protein
LPLLCSFFQSGRANRDLDGGSFDRGRSDRTRRAQRQRLTAADGFFCFAMQSAARAAEKSWRRLLREDDRGEAGLRSDPIHSRSQVDGADGNYLEQDKQATVALSQ